jgi:hypothetical protein
MFSKDLPNTDNKEHMEEARSRPTMCGEGTSYILQNYLAGEFMPLHQHALGYIGALTMRASRKLCFSIPR